MKFNAWLVLPTGRRTDPVPYGNGKQFQYPLFRTRADAKSWQQENPTDRGKIVRVVVSGVNR